MMDALTRVRESLAALHGWRRYGLALVLGALASLAFAPFFLLPLLPLCFTALLWMTPSGRLRPALALGWWFGFGHFVAGLYWITNALLVAPSQFGWLVPFAVAGLSAYFALYPALAVAVAALVRPGWPRIVAFAGAWTLAEYGRGVLLTGFPWNLMGSALVVTPALMQGAALVGTYGLSLLVVAVSASPAALGETGLTIRARVAPVTAAVFVFAAVWGWGAVRLSDAPMPDAQATNGPRLRIVQGDIDQRLKWRADERLETFRTYVRLSEQPPKDGDGRPDAVIWPETAIPYVFDGGKDFLRGLAQAAPRNGVLITGVVRTQSGTPRRIWNSIIAVTSDARLVGRYDKHHLVPFGEYVPLRRFNPLPKLTEGRLDFSAGPGPATLSIPGLPPASPLICYEAIFPGAVTAPGLPRPRWLLNVTNDAWFGDSTGPRQHLASARLRAVEEGLPLIRAANTGVSVATDAYGRVLAELGLGRRGVLDVTLPKAIAEPTLFSRLGNIPLLVAAAFFMALGLAVPRR